MLEAIRILTKEYDRLDFIIRSDVPPKIRKKYAKELSLPNVTVMDKIIPFRDLEQIYISSDIFLLPSKYDAWLITLQAMSYELPVICTHTYFASEFVENNRTGLVIRREKAERYEDGVELPMLSWSKCGAPDLEVVDQLVAKVRVLIRDPERRRMMGKAARQEIEMGKHSISSRNHTLKKIFNEATS